MNSDVYSILCVKDPSSIKKVKYNQAVVNLWKTTISENENEDKSIKKSIANINIGLLEKGSNKSSKSIVFDNVEEAKLYQSEYGGKIIAISKEQLQEMQQEPEYNGLDYGLDTVSKVITQIYDKSGKYIMFYLSVIAEN